MNAYIPKNKAGDVSNAPPANEKKSFRLQDNRPKAAVQLMQVNALAAKSSLPVQRVISFAIGGQTTFEDIDHLKESLKKMYVEKHYKEIDKLVDDTANGGGRAVGAVYVFNEVNRIAAGKKWKRVVPAFPAKGHGPSLPTLNAHKTEEDKEDAMNTFMFGSVTLAKAELTLNDNTVVPFQERQTSSKAHAEDNLVAAINAYLTENKINPKTCRLRITINNAPCGTGHKEKDCAGMLTTYANAKKFKSFSLYFMNPYGSTMSSSVSKMQSADIRVSNFTPKLLPEKLEKSDYAPKTWKKVQKHEKIDPKGIALDPWSDDESSEEESSEEESSEELSSEELSSDQESSEEEVKKRTPAKKGRKKKPISRKKSRLELKKEYKEKLRKRKEEDSDDSDSEEEIEAVKSPQKGKKGSLLVIRGRQTGKEVAKEEQLKKKQRTRY